MHYATTKADRNPLPASYGSEARYLGYRDEDRKKPWAHYFKGDTLPVQPHVLEALAAGPSPSEYGFSLNEAASILSRPGYGKMETGYTILDDGKIMISILTNMPGVTGEMWDWWFGWHSSDTTRYKLWHPDAHYYAGIGEDRSADRSLTDRQRYIDNVSYVDEYLGEKRSDLTVRFIDPIRLGFEKSRPGSTVIAARGGSTSLPVSSAWLIHQVRATEDGAEMRSRFIFNDFQLLDLPPESLSSPQGRAIATMSEAQVKDFKFPPEAWQQLRVIGPDMIYHCASEMNHLASFLPPLFEEFRDTP